MQAMTAAMGFLCEKPAQDLIRIIIESCDMVGSNVSPSHVSLSFSVFSNVSLR